MKSEPLLNAFAKTERAETQINDLNERLKTFVQSRPYKPVSDLNEDGTKRIFRFKLTKKIPREFSVITGEILHNLRSPLDQILCAIAVQAGRTEAGVAFPFGRDKDEFETELGKQKKLPADAKSLIKAAKPHDRGDNLLWALHKLNRRDKHRMGLVPINMPAETMVSHICFWRGLPLLIGSRTGQHMVMTKPFTPADLVETGKPIALYDCRPGYFTFANAGSPGDESLEFMTTTPDAKFDANFQPSLNIAFSNVGLDGQPIIAVLNDMRHLVERILLTFEKRFFS